MKNEIIILIASVFVFFSANATNSTDDVQTMTQKLKGEYKFQQGKTVNLTSEQAAQLLKGEKIKLDDNSEIQLSKKQLENKEKLTTEDIQNLLQGKKSEKKQ